MLRRLLARTAAATSFALIAACSSATALADDAEFDRDFDAARRRWLAARPTNYTFDFHAQSAWFPPGDYTRIEVRDGRIVAARNATTGDPQPTDHLQTIDELWAVLVAARERGETLSQLRFNRLGVPLDAMVGTFADDGGVHYSVRRFVRRQ